MKASQALPFKTTHPKSSEFNLVYLNYTWIIFVCFFLCFSLWEAVSLEPKLPHGSLFPKGNLFPVVLAWWLAVAVLHLHSALYALWHLSRITRTYLASAQTPMWWVSGLLRRVHKLSPSSDSFARPSFMAWPCRHFRVAVESLEETTEAIEVNQPSMRSCDFSGWLSLSLVSLSQL